MAESVPKRPVDALLFIFNADAGLWSAAVDSARKLLRINGCELCSITHGLAGEKGEWKECRAALGVPVEYLHRDEIEPWLADVVGDTLPCVVARVGDEHRILLDPEVLARCRGSVGDLRGRLHIHAAMQGLSIPDLEASAV